MSGEGDVIYLYDGSLEGLLCCVFTAVAEKQLPADIWCEEDACPVFFDTRSIPTEKEKAARVAASIPQKMGPRAKELVANVFLSCAERKELKILRFLMLGYREGHRVTRMLAHPDVAPLIDAEKHLLSEAHLLKGFIRFSDYGQLLGAVIGPKNYVLPLLAPHFCGRLGDEDFMIWDKTHKAVLYRQNGRAGIYGMEQFSPPTPSAAEEQYRRMWKRFYDTIAIRQRENPALRRTHCPKRYWAYMSEMQGES